MHELPMVKSAFEIVLRHAGAAHASRVLTIGLEIGALSELEDEWMQRYFDELSRGTVAEGAVLRISRVPAMFSCRGCGRSFEVDSLPERGVRCGWCASPDVAIGSQLAYRVVGLEVE